MIRTVFVVGPTASGKTEYAIRFAEKYGGEIVSADSMQIYKFMDIGSAKPSAEERERAKHWLIDEVDPRTPFNVSDYQKLAIERIRDIDRRGRLPIVCGGTGLYINSLIYKMNFSAPEGEGGQDKTMALDRGPPSDGVPGRPTGAGPSRRSLRRIPCRADPDSVVRWSELAWSG